MFHIRMTPTDPMRQLSITKTDQTKSSLLNFLLIKLLFLRNTIKTNKSQPKSKISHFWHHFCHDHSTDEKEFNRKNIPMNWERLAKLETIA